MATLVHCLKSARKEVLYLSHFISYPKTLAWIDAKIIIIKARFILGKTILVNQEVARTTSFRQNGSYSLVFA